MISVEKITRRFGSVVAVDALTFTVGHGEVVGLLGPNGAGKTTTMRMLTGTLQPDQGDVLFDGRPISTDLTAARQRIGYLPESNPLYDDMLVCEFLEYVGNLRGLTARAARTAIAKAVDDTDIHSVFFRPIGELSKGFRQRIGLAAAILHNPDILILDEPTEGLDPNQRVELRRLVADLGRERTVLLSTHVMQEVEATCSRVIILTGGRLAAEGSVAELLVSRAGAARYTIEAEGDDVHATLAALPGVTSHKSEPVSGRVRVYLETARTDDLRPLISQLARERGWTVWELYRESASLEEVFRALTTESV